MEVMPFLKSFLTDLPKLFLKHKLSLVLGLAGLILVAVGIVSGLQTSVQPSLEVITKPDEEMGELFIHVAGAVKSPGLYRLKTTSRVNDALVKAGGLTEGADQEWFLTHINLAQKLEDGVKLYIPFKGEDRESKGAVAGEKTAVSEENRSDIFEEKININTAGLQELMELSGIGPTYAQKIIDFRTENGLFLKIEDLMKVPGIGTKTFDNIKSKITI